MNFGHRRWTAIVLFGFTLVAHAGEPVAAGDGARIQPYTDNPRYWQYNGKPVLLVGGAKDDNLFQIPDLKEHLDLLTSVGGNYIRNTMSGRADHGHEVRAFKKLPDGKFDLDRWNSEYWARFESMLKWTHQRDIIVQIEVWAFHDFNQGKWEKNPWNPANTTSYTTSNTRLKPKYGNIGRVRHDFFLTVPELNNDKVAVNYQQRFVDKVLSYTLQYGHVLYCITNEIHPQFSPQWGWYWSGYIKEKAAVAGTRVEITEMYWQPDLTHEQHRASLDHPEIFSFFEGSQNSAVAGQRNWDNLQFVYRRLAQQPRPITHTKIYGADESPWKKDSDRKASESFWRNIIGGSASSRFHRPPWGMGLGEAAQAHIKSMHMLAASIDLFRCTPHNDLLSKRIENGAYVTADPGKEYAVYFPNGGSVDLDVREAEELLRAKWLDIANSRWAKEETLTGGRRVTLVTPGDGHWAVVLNITSRER